MNPTPAPRRYLIETHGCQMNEHDSERIAGLLIEDGLVPATGIEDADVVVLNTCCIRENADNRLYGQLGHLKSLKEQRPGMQIMVGGCLAQKDREALANRAQHVDVVFGTHNVGNAAKLLARSGVDGPILEILEEHDAYPSALPALRATDHTAWVTIQIGCDNSCAFCIVPSVRGKEVSRRVGDIVHEVEALAQDGVREITLLGQNVNSYGRDLGAGQYRPEFSDLLRSLDAIDGIDRIRYTSPHPKDFRADTIAAMAECASVCNHLHLPLQSGSDRILAKMHRGYTAGRYLDKLRAAREAMPDLAVTTDIIIGFPGETDEDFAATLEVAREADYDSAYTFIFSPRQGTEAALMVDEFVAPAVCAQRMELLDAVVEDSALRRHEARVGRVEPVLVEGPSKRNPDMWSGRTGQNKLVHFAPNDVRVGDLVNIRIEKAAPHWLRGVQLDTISSARRARTRLTVTVV